MRKLEKVFSKYGAPMGRPNTLPATLTPGTKLHMQQVYLDTQGYDNGGAYWGLRMREERIVHCTPIGSHHPVARTVMQRKCIYWFYDDDNQISGFLDAFDRTEAKAIIRQDYPDVKFFK